MATGGRILELTPSQEEAVVARVLVLVHKAVDEHFPAAGNASRQFTKTLFSDEASEPTAVGRIPGDDDHGRTSGEGAPGGAFAEVEVTSPDGHLWVAPDPATAGGEPLAVPPPSVAAAAAADRRPSSASFPDEKAALPSTPPSGESAAAPPSPLRPPPSSERRLPPPQTSSSANAAAAANADDGATTAAGLPSSTGRDWQMIVTLALLVAGLILLAYALLT